MADLTAREIAMAKLGVAGANHNSGEAKATAGVGWAILALADAITAAVEKLSAPHWEQPVAAVSDPTPVEPVPEDPYPS